MLTLLNTTSVWVKNTDSHVPMLQFQCQAAEKRSAEEQGSIESLICIAYRIQGALEGEHVSSLKQMMEELSF